MFMSCKRCDQSVKMLHDPACQLVVQIKVGFHQCNSTGNYSTTIRILNGFRIVLLVASNVSIRVRVGGEVGGLKPLPNFQHPVILHIQPQEVD